MKTLAREIYGIRKLNKGWSKPPKCFISFLVIIDFNIPFLTSKRITILEK